MELNHILLVEDSPQDLELALEALKEARLSNGVVVVRDGEEALQYLRRQGPYAGRKPGLPVLVLLDLKMPRVDGLQVLKEMRSDPELAMVRVVMLTSSREEGDILQSYSSGAQAYVVKPVDFRQFVEAIKQIGSFWAILNEPPPRNLSSPQPSPSSQLDAS